MGKTETYLQEFKPQAAEWFSKADFVQANVAFFTEFFARENLETIEWSRIQKMGEHLHCFGSMQIAKANALGKPNHSIEHYRKSFLFLAHGSGTAAERIRKFWKDKEYRLDYFGHSAISELAGYLFPDEFMFVNARDKFAAKFLGIDVKTPTGADFVDKRLAFAKATRPAAHQYEQIVGKQTELPLNLELDQFFSWIYETKGSDVKEIPGDPDDDVRYWTIAAGRGGKRWTE